MVREYQRQMARMIVPIITLVLLAQKVRFATLCEYLFLPMVE